MSYSSPFFVYIKNIVTFDIINATAYNMSSNKKIDYNRIKINGKKITIQEMVVTIVRSKFKNSPFSIDDVAESLEDAGVAYYLKECMVRSVLNTMVLYNEIYYLGMGIFSSIPDIDFANANLALDSIKDGERVSVSKRDAERIILSLSGKDIKIK